MSLLRVTFAGVSTIALLVLVVAGSYGAPTPSLFHDAAHLQEHIRLLKVGTLDPLMKRYVSSQKVYYISYIALHYRQGQKGLFIYTDR